ncbi:glycoside hydrolase family 105 protein [Verrucomicrobiota bacterium]
MVQANENIKNQQRVGLRVAEKARQVAVSVVERQERNMEIEYDRVCSYYGALCFAEATGDRGLRERIKVAYTPCLSGEIKPRIDHVDNNLFGILPFELFRQTGEHEYLPVAKYLAEEEFDNPREDGLTRYTRFWADDMYMVGSLQAQAHKSLRDSLYADRGANHLLAYLQRLQRADGLIQHHPETPIVWARGCGWAAAGITEVLLTLPNHDSKRKLLLNAYQKLADALIEYQTASGMWLQVVDEPDAWPETSGTGMFIFALATGVKERWVDSNSYGEAAERAWRALTTYIDSAGRVSETSRGVAPVGATLSAYLSAPHLTNDFHGLAAVLWAATSLVNLEGIRVRH